MPEPLSNVLDQFRQGDINAFESLFHEHQSAVHGWILRWQDLARRPAVAADRPVALDLSGGGPRATSIFSVTLSDARDRRRTLAESPFGTTSGSAPVAALGTQNWMLAWARCL